MRRDSDEAISPAELFSTQPWSDEWTPAGVVKVLEPMVAEERRARIREVLNLRLNSVTLVMDSPHDPHNGAAILRSCDAFGVQQVHVVRTKEPFLASNVVSRGTERWVDVIEHDFARTAADSLRARGFELVASHSQGELVPEDLRQIPRVALVMGNEHRGISDELMESAGRSVRIPMVGFVESLNVSVSAALLLRAASYNRPGDLDPEDYSRLYARGLFRSVKRASEILAAVPAS